MKNTLIYKYADLNMNTIKMLIRGELWFGYPTNLNDPFEGEFLFDVLDHSITTKRIANFYSRVYKYHNKKEATEKANSISPEKFKEQLYKYVKDKFKKEYGVSCFSEKPDNILMWSHYARSHQGLCLIFDSELLFESLKSLKDDIKMGTIIYKKSLPTLSVMMSDKGVGILRYTNEPNDIFLYKLEHWSTENEIRFYSESFYKNRRNIPFDKSAIKGIIFGQNTSPDDENLVVNLMRNNKYEVNDSSFYKKAEINIPKGAITFKEPYMASG